MAGLTKSIVSITKDKFLLPIGSKSIEITWSYFVTVNDLSKYLEANGLKNISFTNLNGIVLGPGTFIKDIKHQQMLLSVNDKIFKLIPSLNMFHFNNL